MTSVIIMLFCSGSSKQDDRLDIHRGGKSEHRPDDHRDSKAVANGDREKDS